MAGTHIAVIGSGISGLSAAWLMSRSHRVTLIERDGRVGGHANTVDVGEGARPIPIDTGFIVYNNAGYPNLTALFDHLAVPTVATTMSFAVSLDGGGYEYSGSGVRGLFGQPSNVFRPSHWQMAADILRFFRDAGADIARQHRDGADDQPLGAWLRDRGYSRGFIERHIVPMGAAIWSMPGADVLSFPAAAFFRFFANHGLLQVANRPAWRTVRGGSREYVRRLLDASRLDVITNTRATRIERVDRADRPGIAITLADGRVIAADHVVIATHADEALALLSDADDRERRLLGAFRYATNRTVLHRDPALMPKRRGLWSSWNVLGRPFDRAVCVTYWMNRLQPLSTDTDHFVTLNPVAEIASRHVLARFHYAHPTFTAAAISAQRELWSLQGRRGTWFAGSYFGFGFHEDGIQSGLAVAEALTGERRPWTVPADSWHRMPTGAGVAVGARPIDRAAVA